MGTSHSESLVCPVLYYEYKGAQVHHVYIVLCNHYMLNHTGGDVVHSYGRLMPHEFPITDLQQISGPDGIGRINCTVSSGTAEFSRLPPSELLETGGVTVRQTGTTTTLIVNPNGRFENREMCCRSQFYLYISDNSEFISCNAHNMHACLRVAGAPFLNILRLINCKDIFHSNSYIIIIISYTGTSYVRQKACNH